MAKELIVSATSLETRLAILEEDQVTEIFIEREKNKGILGNIYKGRVTKVLPGMQAAFVDIGLERHAFLYVADFFEDYEEYEELFKGVEEPDEPVIRVAKTEPDPRRNRRGRRGGHRDSASGRDDPTAEEEIEAAPAPIEERLEAASADMVEPVERVDRAEREMARPRSKSRAPSVAPNWTGGRPPKALAAAPETASPILPETLNLPHPPREAEPSWPSTEPAGAGALPDFLPGWPRPTEPVSREASLEAPPKLPRFSTRSEPRGKGRRSGRGNSYPALIGDLLREGQEILVQVAKEPIGKKGARITSHVALPGRHLVFMPTVDHVGVSRKIASDKERARLKEMVQRLRGDYGKGFIVRTVGENHSEQDFANDMAYLTRLWEDVKVKAERRSAPALIHAEPDLLQRIIRDHFSEEYRAIRVDDEQEYARIVEFVSTFNPELVNRVRLYSKRKPIFDEHGVSTEIEKALKHKVWLKNGGHIVINQTEALVAIDVNTGKFVGRTNSLEETITKTNLGAVREVVRQIRLRDLGGIIIIDFIDMDESRNRQKVMEALQSELAKDKSPSKILRFNEFGLVAITRKRVKQSLEKALCQPCIYCSGTGMTKSVRTVAYSMHQEARRLAPSMGDGTELLIRCHPEIAKALRNGEKDVVREIEEVTGKTVSIKSDPLMHIEQFDLVEA